MESFCASVVAGTAVLFARMTLMVLRLLKTWPAQMDLFALVLVVVVLILKTWHVSQQLAQILEQTQM